MASRVYPPPVVDPLVAAVVNPPVAPRGAEPEARGPPRQAQQDRLKEARNAAAAAAVGPYSPRCPRPGVARGQAAAAVNPPPAVLIAGAAEVVSRVYPPPARDPLVAVVVNPPVAARGAEPEARGPPRQANNDRLKEARNAVGPYSSRCPRTGVARGQAAAVVVDSSAVAPRGAEPAEARRPPRQAQQHPPPFQARHDKSCWEPSPEAPGQEEHTTRS